MRFPTNFLFSCAALFVIGEAHAQLARDWPKPLGNITTDNQVRSDFSGLWNQITPETCASWYVIEGQRGVRNWKCLDSVVAYARRKGIPWTFQSLIPSGSYPGWITSLSNDSLKSAVEDWFSAVAQRYPDVPTVVVVDEPHPQHFPNTRVAAALGGPGQSGVLWVANALRMARKHFPNATLMIEDFDNIEYGKTAEWFRLAVRDIVHMHAAPLDAIGCEAHAAGKVPLDTLRHHLDALWNSSGLPVHVTQFDISSASDSIQLELYRTRLPLLYEHPSVRGVTIWGYVLGRTWIPSSGLMDASGAERPALTWLRSYKPPTAPASIRPGSHRSIPMSGLMVRERSGHLVTGVERNGQFFAITALGRNLQPLHRAP